MDLERRRAQPQAASTRAPTARATTTTTTSGPTTTTNPSGSRVFQTPALTTLFTPPPECNEQRLTMLESDAYRVWLNEPIPVPGSLFGSCYPDEFISSYAAAKSGDVAQAFSPLVCPENYYTAVNRTVENKPRYVACCPSSFAWRGPDIPNPDRPGFGGSCYSNIGATVLSVTSYDNSSSVAVIVHTFTASDQAFAHPFDGFVDYGVLLDTSRAAFTPTLTGSPFTAAATASETPSSRPVFTQAQTRGLTVGIVGGAALLICVLVALFFYWRRRGRRQQARLESQQYPPFNCYYPQNPNVTPYLNKEHHLKSTPSSRNSHVPNAIVVERFINSTNPKTGRPPNIHKGLQPDASVYDYSEMAGNPIPELPAGSFSSPYHSVSATALYTDPNFAATSRSLHHDSNGQPINPFRDPTSPPPNHLPAFATTRPGTNPFGGTTTDRSGLPSNPSPHHSNSSPRAHSQPPHSSLYSSTNANTLAASSHPTSSNNNSSTTQYRLDVNEREQDRQDRFLQVVAHDPFLRSLSPQELATSPSPQRMPNIVTDLAGNSGGGEGVLRGRGEGASGGRGTMRTGISPREAELMSAGGTRRGWDDIDYRRRTGEGKGKRGSDSSDNWPQPLFAGRERGIGGASEDRENGAEAGGGMGERQGKLGEIARAAWY